MSTANKWLLNKHSAFHIVWFIKCCQFANSFKTFFVCTLFGISPSHYQPSQTNTIFLWKHLERREISFCSVYFNVSLSLVIFLMFFFWSRNLVSMLSAHLDGSLSPQCTHGHLLGFTVWTPQIQLYRLALCLNGHFYCQKPLLNGHF